MRGLRFARALAAELRGADAVLAHMCPIYAVLAAPLARPLGVPRAALVHALAREPAPPRRDGRLDEGAQRRPPLVPARDRRSSSHSGTGSTSPGSSAATRAASEELRAVVLGRTSPAKGLETILRAVAQVPDARLDVYGTSGSRRGARPPRRARAADRRARPRRTRRDPRAGAAGPRSASSTPSADVLVNNMRAGAPDKVVYEACGSCLPALASNPSFDELFAGIEPPLRFERESADELAERLRALAALDAAGASRDRTNPARARGRGPLGRHVGGGRAGGRAQGMKNVRVLHLAKVAGISGSEAHLLSLLPSLVERGWDVRFLMLHEHEPGAWDFARELESQGVHARRDPARRRRRSGSPSSASAPISRGDGRRSCTRTSSTPTSTASSPGRRRACRFA